MGRPANTVERMMRDHVEKTPTCWLWLGLFTPNGYPKTSIRTRTMNATRVFYQHFRGDIPLDFYVGHTCDHKHCVNPNHLIALDPRDSVLRGLSPPAGNARKVECLRGHPLNGENLYVTPDGRRQCCTCRAMHSRKSK